MDDGIDDGGSLPPPAPGASVFDDTPVALQRTVAAPANSPDRRLMIGGALLIVVGLAGLALAILPSGNTSEAEANLRTDTASDVEVDDDRAERTTVPVVPRPTDSTPFAASDTAPDSTPDPSNSATGTTTSVPPPPPTTEPGPPPTAPPLNDEPAVVARPVPVEPPPPPPEAPPPPWAESIFTTSGGHVSTDVGCAADTSAAALDVFFAQQIGPVLGWDYQHVYALGGGRYLWLFQDTFVDQSGTAATLDKASFIHNSALVQEGSCFRLLHRGNTSRPQPFEIGQGTTTLQTWYWPMGGEVHNGRLFVFWARMIKDSTDPKPPDGLGWHPNATFVGTYDINTLARLDFRQATQGAATPIWGYAVESDDTHTYLFGNTFEQNLTREGGWFNGPHSGTQMFLARVDRGRVFDQPEYWTAAGWIQDERLAEPFLQRHWAEFPMQPRYIDGQWVASTAVNGYWGDSFELDVANDPWGPWTTVEARPLLPRGADPKMNTYHAHLLPWRDGFGQLIVSVSNNARDMLRDAWPNPYRYRPTVFASPWQEPPPPTTTTTTTTVPPTTTTSTVPPTTTTTVPPTTTTTTTSVPTTTTTSTPPSTTTTTTAPPQTSTTEPEATTTTTAGGEDPGDGEPG